MAESEVVAGEGRGPRFSLDAADRRAIDAFRSDGAHGAGSAAPAFAAAQSVARLNCTACHVRDGVGGLSREATTLLRRFESEQDAEAVTPPSLTAVASKLRHSWLQAVLSEGRRARPWMALRMPQFAPADVRDLPRQLAAVDGLAQADPAASFPFDAERAEVGRQLVGAKGFGCISCHDIAGRPNFGTRGPDLAGMQDRVRYEWYGRWLVDPQRIHAGTRMPTVFPGGVSTVTNRLGGRSELQAQAMWEYLALGPNMPLPEGLVSPRGSSLIVGDKPLILRTFMPETRARSFAIGFPGPIGFAFDSERCRLAYGWSGGFINTSPVWDNRGGNQAGLEGSRFWTAPDGMPWTTRQAGDGGLPDWNQLAADADLGAPLPDGQVAKSPPRLQFEGYRVAKDGAVRFRYFVATPGSGVAAKFEEQVRARQEVAGVAVIREFGAEFPGGGEGWLRVARSAAPPRAVDDAGAAVALGEAEKLRVPTAARHLIVSGAAGRPHLISIQQVPANAEWVIYRAKDGWEVCLRLPAVAGAAGQTTVAVAIASPYRDDPLMIRELVRSAVAAAAAARKGMP